MDANKASERIQMLLQRTEERGASEAEENTAARMVCKLLRDFPQLLSKTGTHNNTERRQEQAYTHARPPYPGNDRVSITYQCIVRQTEKAVLVMINYREVWLPLKQVSFKVSVIVMPRWLAQAKDLI